MNSYQAKQLSLPDIMSRIGYKPDRIEKGGNEYWYKSPFRSEQEASFHTSYLGGKWIWNDFGDTGGTVIDFIIRHEQCSGVGEALSFLDNMYSGNSFSFQQQKMKLAASEAIESSTGENPLEEKTFILDNVKPLKHPALLDYITKNRAIDLSIARVYLKEVHFHNNKNGKKYFALGMKNESGGYEIRNQFFKSSLGQKDLSIIKRKGRGEISIFEGYIDFLSFLTMQEKAFLQGDVLILNSIVFATKAKVFILQQNYNKIYTFFDNDTKGMETLALFQELPIEVVALNRLYENCKDYNEYLQEAQKKLK